jgi:hypothetical protein
MNAPVDRPREALVELITATRDAQSTAILEQARTQARERVRNAFQEARIRAHRAIEGERQRSRNLLAVNAARLDTHNRQHYQDAVQHLLARARHRLDAALRARWAEPDSRRQWLDHLLGLARQRLPASAWTITHPADWDAAELERWHGDIRDATGSAPILETSDGIAAGLRIQAGGACLDGSLEGLLADERAIQAQLLARLEAALPTLEPGSTI